MSDKPSSEKVEESTAREAPARVPYRRPVLVQLGSIRDLTLSTGFTGAGDNSKKFPNRTGRGGRFAADGSAA